MTIAILLWASISGGILVAEEPVLSEKVYMTTSDALATFFPDLTHVTSHNIVLSPSQNQQIQTTLGMSFSVANIILYKGYNRDQFLGYAFHMDELGKHYPITMMVYVTPTYQIGDLAVLIYREIMGRKVRKRRFLKQFIGKTLSNSLMINRDIHGISGATISSWSVATASKKALLLADAISIQKT